MYVCVLAVKLRPNPCNPMDCRLPDSSVHGILWKRIQEWIVISFSRRSSQPRDQTCISCIAGGFFTSDPPEKPLEDCFCPVAKLCPTLHPTDCSMPGFPVLHYFLEFPQSHVQLFATLWRSPPGSSVYGIFQAGIWSRLPIPSPGHLPDPGIEPVNPCLLHWLYSA